MVFVVCGDWHKWAKKWPDPALGARGQAMSAPLADQALFQSVICCDMKVFRLLSLATLASIALYCAR